MALEPVFAGAVQVTVTVSLPLVTEPIVGAPGRSDTVGEVKDGSELPMRFSAVTRNLYELPEANPVTDLDSAVEALDATTVHVSESDTAYSTV
jgi:hypothetical protein